jgi:hypothetical protein
VVAIVIIVMFIIEGHMNCGRGSWSGSMYIVIVVKRGGAPLACLSTFCTSWSDLGDVWAVCCLSCDTEADRDLWIFKVNSAEKIAKRLGFGPEVKQSSVFGSTPQSMRTSRNVRFGKVQEQQEEVIDIDVKEQSKVLQVVPCMS